MRRWPWAVGGALLVGLVAAVVAARSDVSEAPARVHAADEQPPVSSPETLIETSPRNGVRLGAPSPDDRANPPLAHVEPSAELLATAYYLDAPVFARPKQEPDVLGLVRRGRLLPVEERAYGPGCDGGAWYRLSLGYVCTRLGFVVSSSPSERAQRHADPTAHLPFAYASVRRGIGALRLHRPPRARELPKLATLRSDAEASKPEVVDLRMEGDYFVALDEEVEGEGGPWVRTVRGRYVHADDLEAAPISRLVGSPLDGEVRLPLAFVYGEARPLYRIDGSEAHEIGEADVYARLSVRERVQVGDARYVVDADGRALARSHVRLARRTERPSRVPEGARWIHVDLSEQTLVAYEGDRPVYATLVATGREGYETPRGTFRVREKHVSTTMRGEDPVDGPYEVEEVPWTQYYWRSYAIHGAYWHDAFGEVRSHGCTNLAPADARHLFDWTSPRVPDGFHARRLRAGTWLHFTR